MRAAVVALAAYTSAQGQELLDLAITETFETIEVPCPISDLGQALLLAASVVREGGVVSIVLNDEEDNLELTLRSERLDEWTLEGALDPFYPQLAAREVPDRWTTTDFSAGPPDVAFKASAKTVLEKSRWAGPVSRQTGRTVWMGITTSAFIDWLRRGSWTSPLKRLFAKPGALILLGDWESDASDLGPRLTIGHFESRANTAPADALWPEPTRMEILRVLDVDVGKAQPPELKSSLVALVGAAAAWLLGEERSTDWSRPSRQASTRWEIGKDRSQLLRNASAIVALAQWVKSEANAMRLAIARQVGAAMIPTASEAGDSSAVLGAADIAYHTAIDDSVRTALQSQLDLERSFQGLDSKLTELRDTLTTSVDSTIIRTLTAALGIVIAALTVADARGWPTVLASAAVAAYVLFTAWWTLRTMQEDFTARLDMLRKLVQARSIGLGDELGKKIDDWKAVLKKRLVRAQVALTILAAVVGVGGATLGQTIGQAEGVTPTPIPLTPTPSHS